MSQGAVGREIALWKWVLVGLVIWVICYMAVVSRVSIAQRLQTEHQYNEAFLGPAAALHAERRAAGWFKNLIVDRGLLDHSGFGGPDPSFDSNKSETVRKIGMGIDAAKGWAAARVAVMWGMGFYAGYVGSHNELEAIVDKLELLLANKLWKLAE